MVRKQGARPRKQPRQTAYETEAREKRIRAAIAEVDQLQPATRKAAKVISLLKKWLTDESGYDEETWPELKKAIGEERRRVGARRL